MTQYDNLKRVMNLVTDLGAAAAVLGWDQETFMPDGAVMARAEQLATLSTLAHHYMTNDEAQRAVADIRPALSSLSDRERRVSETFIRDHERSLKLPAELVTEGARVASLAQDAWKKARAASDFSLFQPMLERTVELKKREAEILGPGKHPYDVMLDTYEPGLTVDQVTPIFDRLREGTREILSHITPRQSSVSDVVLYRHYPKNEQLDLAKKIITHLGFSEETGRVDLSAHPFCTQFDSSDVRLTTRIRENDLRSCLFGLIHESGHGMYEQGVSKELSRTPSGQGASMGIHESQSLFWENVIARSEEFWHWAFPMMRTAFPDQLKDQDPSSFFRAINKMQPSLNRVESDELTYNLHIILRFEIERDLMSGALAVKDIPTAWNEKMNASLGVVPPNDAEGCLQDVHWSFGGIGYFPSYTLGKLYAAMEWNQMQQEMPGVADRVANGDFAPILNWLRVKIHDFGRTETPNEIIQRVAGRPLTETDFLEYVGAKAARVYGF
ncbi:MAG: carboxypeptidase M32 [Ignavibacteriae bacterium]|nr:MAG: carboxypeptidase M32 [Ignavibacteriota bacterium]